MNLDLRVVLTVPALVLAACGSSIDAEDFRIDLCGTSLLAGIELTPPVDSLELRGNAGTIDRIGEPCARAERRAECEKAVQAATTEGGFSVPTSRVEPADREYFVFTRGDEVGTIGDVSALLAVMGDVDRAPEARVLAVLNGFRPACRLRQEGGAFEAYAEQGLGCGQRDAIVVRVSPAGVVSEADRDVLDPGNEGCTSGP